MKWLRCSLLPQELHRAAVRHERDEGGSGADPAPLRALTRPRQASLQNTSDHPSLQERNSPVRKENPLMLENVLPLLEEGSKQMTGQCFSGAKGAGQDLGMRIPDFCTASTSTSATTSLAWVWVAWMTLHRPIALCSVSAHLGAAGHGHASSLVVPSPHHEGWPGLGTSAGPTSFLLTKSCLGTHVLDESMTIPIPAPSSAPSSVPRGQPSPPAAGAACGRPRSLLTLNVSLFC